MIPTSPYAKAVLGGLAAALSFAVPIVDDGLTTAEVLGILSAALAGAGVVYAVPNSGRRRRHR